MNNDVLKTSSTHVPHVETETETETIVLLKRTEEKNPNPEIVLDYSIEIYPTFNDFWNEYDKKKGDLPKLKSKWAKLSQATKEAIMLFIPEYKKSQPDKQFRLNPETFFNQKGWTHELIYKTSNNNTNGKQSINTVYEKGFDTIKQHFTAKINNPN